MDIIIDTDGGVDDFLAVAMALRGADWRSIVKRYFPNVRITN